MYSHIGDIVIVCVLRMSYTYIICTTAIHNVFVTFSLEIKIIILVVLRHKLYNNYLNFKFFNSLGRALKHPMYVTSVVDVTCYGEKQECLYVV